MKSAPQRPIFVSVNIKQKYMKLILRLGLILFTGFISISTASAQLYGTADTNAPELRVPTSVKPAFDYWMRDTWATLGPDGYYYITGTTSTPDRYFPGQRHCWDWNDGLYLWRSKDMKSWEARGQIWSMEKDGTWQKKPKVYKAGEKYQKKSINGDPMDNRFHAVWAPEMHYIKSVKNWFIVACMNESAGGRGSFILRSKTGKPEGPYENIEGNKDKAIFPNIDGSLFEDTDGTVYFVGHNHYIARMKPDMSGFAEELKTAEMKERNITLYSDMTAEPYGDDVIGLLSSQICSPVQWETIIRNMVSDGVDTFIEIGPGKTLTNMIKKISADVKAVNITEYLAEAEGC